MGSLAALATLARAAIAAADAPPDPQTPRRGWLVTLPDGERFSLTCTPAATLADLQGRYPGAHIEPEPDAPPAPPLTGEALALAHAYLRHCDEIDLEIGNAWLDGLAADPARLRGLYAELVRLELATWDDPPRASCGRCRHFQPDPINPSGGLGRCLCDAPASRQPGSLWPRGEIHCRAFEAIDGGDANESNSQSLASAPGTLRSAVSESW